MENRVYEVEIEVLNENEVRSPSDRFRIAKFYRPGRWSKAQILDEHRFLQALVMAEVPVVAPVSFDDGQTLHQDDATGIFFALFRKQGGRSPDELLMQDAEQIGRLIARVHAVGMGLGATSRVTLSAQSYGRDALAVLEGSGMIPLEIRRRYNETVCAVVESAEQTLRSGATQSVHGDLHLGNLLWRDGPFLVDFDDMVTGPCVQDLWLILPGRDLYAKEIALTLLAGYETMRDFDRSQFRLVETLRVLRMIHYAAWIAKRWDDPIFQRTFSNFSSNDYWRAHIVDVEDQLRLMREGFNLLTLSAEEQ